MNYCATRGSLLLLFYPQLLVIKDITLRQTVGLWEELRKTEFMPIGIREVKIPLPPGAILDCGRGQSLGDSGVVDGLDIVHAENGTPPPCGLKME